MDMPRASGVLLHPTSLPGPFEIGELGQAAYRFADFLVDAGQTLWQSLPLGPTGYGNSPYMCFSAFGGNELLISLEQLVDAGLLDASDLSTPPAFPDDFYGFCERHAFWLEDYALFTALKEAHDGRVWTTWDDGAAHRDSEALVLWRNKLAEAVERCKFAQYVFFRQWMALKRYCHERGVSIIGDVPIYVAHDSAEAWAILPLQDVLGLGSQARMNLPGARQGNWEWRFTADLLTPALTERLFTLTQAYGRSPDHIQA